MRNDHLKPPSIKVTTTDPEGGVVENENHAQSTLTVKAYWEDYPPENSADESKYVINKTYTLDQLEELGTTTQTYTAVGASSYYTMTGRGVLLSTLLKDAGVNIKGMKQIAFGTADNIDRPVSSNFVFDTNRYYYPNIDVNSHAEKVQVAPMIAFESSEIRSGSTEPNYDFSDHTRYRLLFGAKADGSNNSQYQIKWINTLYVMLEGGPAAEEENGGNDGNGGNGTDNGGSKDKSGNSSGTTGSGTAGSGSGSGRAGTGSDGGSQGNSGGESATKGNATAAEGASGGQTQATAATDGAGSQSGYKVYQVMNRYKQDVEKDLDYENPYAPYAAPLGVAVLISGAMESLIWFRRQTMAVAFLRAG